MGKKILGYVFFLLGILCVLSFVGNVFKLIIGIGDETITGFSETLPALIFVVILGFIFFKYGYKWTKRKPKEIDEIDSIGE